MPRISLSIRYLSLVSIAALAVSICCFAQTETVLYSFDSSSASDGFGPVSNLVRDTQGNLYGTTPFGGGCTTNCGIVFQLTPPTTGGDSWIETAIHMFGVAPSDGSSPRAGLIADSKGNLYGTTIYGGTGNCNLGGPTLGCGTVFELSPPATAGGAWTETVLYSFQGGTADGRFPTAAVTFDSQGNLYGTTTSGGNGFCNGFPGDCGIAFRLSPPTKSGAPWRERILHNFGNGTDGQHPNSALIVDASGVLFGTTEFGGNNDCSPDFGADTFCGTIFQFAPPSSPTGRWVEQFTSLGPAASRGFFLSAGLVQGASGKLFGATALGPALNGSTECIDNLGFGEGCGVIFGATPPSQNNGRWHVATLYSFSGGSDGALPLSSLTFYKGSLYGVANGSGGLGSCIENRQGPITVSINGCGTVFKLSPPSSGTPWTETTLHQFSGGSDGSQPVGSLLSDGKGNFFGTTFEGGTGSACLDANGCGTIFELTP